MSLAGVLHTLFALEIVGLQGAISSTSSIYTDSDYVIYQSDWERQTIYSYQLESVHREVFALTLRAVSNGSTQR